MNNFTRLSEFEYHLYSFDHPFILEMKSGPEYEVISNKAIATNDNLLYATYPANNVSQEYKGEGKVIDQGQEKKLNFQVNCQFNCYFICQNIKSLEEELIELENFFQRLFQNI